MLLLYGEGFGWTGHVVYGKLARLCKLGFVLLATNCLQSSLSPLLSFELINYHVRCNHFPSYESLHLFYYHYWPAVRIAQFAGQLRQF